MNKKWMAESLFGAVSNGKPAGIRCVSLILPARNAQFQRLSGGDESAGLGGAHDAGLLVRIDPVDEQVHEIARWIADIQECEQRLSLGRRQDARGAIGTDQGTQVRRLLRRGLSATRGGATPMPQRWPRTSAVFAWVSRSPRALGLVGRADKWSRRRPLGDLR